MKNKSVINSVLSEKLKKYSLAAGAVLAAGTAAQAQVVYTNDADSILNAGDIYDIDLNNDAVMDFRIQVYQMSNTSTYTIGTNTNHPIIGYTSVSNLPIYGTTFTYSYTYIHYQVNGAQLSPLYGGQRVGSYFPYALSNNNAVDNNASFGSAPWLQLTYSHDIYGSGTYGYFGGQGNKFIGVRFPDGIGNTYYGWIRINVQNINGEPTTILDWAYEAKPGKGILTGLPLNTASNIVVADNADNHNSSDIQVSFDKAANELNIAEYQIFIVKADTVDSLATIDYSALTGYTVAKTGSNITVTLPAGLNDVNGNPVVEDTTYKIIVASIPTGAPNDSSAFTISDTSNAFTLMSITNVAENNDAVLTMYPNPTRGELFIALKNDVSSTIKITDISGKVVYEQTNAVGTLRVDLSAQPKGIYFAHITSGNTVETQKIVLE